MNTTKNVMLSALLKSSVVDGNNGTLGRVHDLVITLHEGDYPSIAGLVLKVGRKEVFVPAARIVSIDANKVELKNARLDMRDFTRRAGEVLLRADILGHRLIDVDRALLVRAFDVQIAVRGKNWIVTALDVHRRGIARLSRHAGHPVRDWMSFEALIGHAPTALARSAGGRVKDLKAAQIADLIEDASPEEQDELLATVHTEPELEADVFEELEDDEQAKLLRNRPDAEVAEIISNMRADDAADAIMELQQDRRIAVLGLLTEPQQTRVRTLLGYGEATAGGLMGVEFATCTVDGTVADALAAVRTAATKQPEALAAIFLTTDEDQLAGVISLIEAVQSDLHTPLRDVADLEPIHTHPDNDLIDAVRLMTDFNILVLPIIERGSHEILGVITVDDALEAAIPDQWRKRDVELHRLHANDR